MELQKQVTSLELSKKLHELGVKQESLFAYYDKPVFVNEKGKQCGDLNQRCGVLAFGNRIIKNDCEIIAFDAGEADMSNAYYDKGEIKGRTWKGGRYSAFTVAELGEMLPNETNLGFLGMEKTGKGDMTLWYGEVNNGSWITADTEADARAKMLIYLIENKLINL